MPRLYRKLFWVLKKEQIAVRVAQQAQQVLKLLRRQLPVLHSSSKTCRRYLKAYRSRVQLYFILLSRLM